MPAAISDLTLVFAVYELHHWILLFCVLSGASLNTWV